jgi:hypothetical protein
MKTTNLTNIFTEEPETPDNRNFNLWKILTAVTGALLISGLIITFLIRYFPPFENPPGVMNGFVALALGVGAMALAIAVPVVILILISMIIGYGFGIGFEAARNR